MTTPEITIIITTVTTGIVTVINALKSPSRGQVSELHDKAIEIKTQTNGNHTELVKKVDMLLAENNSLREQNITLEKAVIVAAAAMKPGEQRQVRSSDMKNGGK